MKLFLFALIAASFINLSAADAATHANGVPAKVWVTALTEHPRLAESFGLSVNAPSFLTEVGKLAAALERMPMTLSDAGTKSTREIFDSYAMVAVRAAEDAQDSPRFEEAFETVNAIHEVSGAMTNSNRIVFLRRYELLVEANHIAAELTGQDRSAGSELYIAQNRTHRGGSLRPFARARRSEFLMRAPQPAFREPREKRSMDFDDFFVRIISAMGAVTLIGLQIPIWHTAESPWEKTIAAIGLFGIGLAQAGLLHATFASKNLFDSVVLRRSLAFFGGCTCVVLSSMGYDMMIDSHRMLEQVMGAGLAGVSLLGALGSVTVGFLPTRILLNMLP